MSTFYVPKKMHPSLIGRGGETVKKLTADHKVRISIPRSDDPSSAIDVTGRDSDVEQVRVAMEAILGRGCISAQPLQKIALDIPKNRHGALVGPQASVLRKLESDSGCAINVPRQGEGSSHVELEGSAAAIEAAKREIAKILGSAPRVVAAGAAAAAAAAETKEEPAVQIDLSKPIAEVLFFPDKNVADGQNVDRFLAYLALPTRTLDVCVFTITDNRIATILTKLHRKGVRVRVISDNDCAKQLGSDVEHLARSGVPVKLDVTEHHMHHKFCVADGKFVMSGSYNWTTAASSNNHENIMITNNPEFVRQFGEHFERMWNDRTDFEAFNPQ